MQRDPEDWGSVIIKDYNMINRMIALAAEKHAGQVDLAGVPYIFHIMAVTEYTREMWGHEDEELLAIAAGHDLIEDTDVHWQYLADNFGYRVANGILSLSKFDGHPYTEYQAGVLRNVDAMMVKLCDLLHNMREPLDVARLLKYEEFYDLIEDTLDEAGIY